jgi:uncharacterized LabA/DUF88 family protein
MVYVDGLNLFFGLRAKKWQRYYWLDVAGLAGRLLKPQQTLAGVKYFTSRVSGNSAKEQRQKVYLEALEAHGGITMFFGRFQFNQKRCGACGAVAQVPQEKMTDVNIAVSLLADAFQDQFDTAILISADSDLAGPIRAVRELFPAKRIVIAFPPKRFSNDLSGLAHAHFTIGRANVAASQLANPLAKPDGQLLARPAQWQ